MFRFFRGTWYNLFLYNSVQLQKFLHQEKIKLPISFLSLWKILLLLLLMLILGRFIVVGESKVLFNTISSDGDESAFLSFGLALREEGRLSDGGRAPLYPLLLATFAEREWAYFTHAKMMTLGLGVLAIVATFLVGQSLFSGETALLAAFLLAANKEFHLRASTIYADTLYVSVFLGTWYFLIKSFEGKRYCILAGIFCGLAYLNKGSGPLLLAAWGVVALLYYRNQILQHRELLLVPLFFFITASPLLLYNNQVFGSPFYSLDSAHVMWMDKWAEREVTDPADMPTFATYMQTHTIADIATRFKKGFVRLNNFLPQVFIPSRALNPPWLGYGFLIVSLAGLGALLIWRRQWLVIYYHHHRLILQVSVALFAIYYFFSVWYASLQVESRFFIPLLGPVYLLLSDGLIRLGQRLGQNLAHKIYMAGVGALILLGSSWLISTTLDEVWSLSVDPFASDRQANVATEAMLSWLIHDHPAEMGAARVAFGPSKSLPLWKFPRYFTIQPIPIDLENLTGLQEYLQKIEPQYIIIDYDTVRRRRNILSDYFSFHDKKFEIQRIPPDWMLTYLYDKSPHTWGIFRPSHAPAVSVMANFNNQIELLGYEMRTRDDTNLYVTLYWRAMTAISTNYTVFVHLTAPDGFVKAQQDQPPFNGFWPTRQWRKGDTFADHYQIPIHEGVPSGEYLLVVGLYTPSSGQRLPMLKGPAAPSSEGVLLGKMKF